MYLQTRSLSTELKNDMGSIRYIASAGTDDGLSGSGNQDSFGVKILQTPIGEVAAAVMCDGMGGYKRGEVASATVVDAFQRWVVRRLPLYCRQPLDKDAIFEEWTGLVELCNMKIRSYGQKNGIRIGTTALMFLAAAGQYMILNVGDCRAYEIKESALQITVDQTVAQREVDAGRLSPEEAVNDKRSHILLECIGASVSVKPDCYTGVLSPDSVYMFCCDGFRRKITSSEISGFLNPYVMTSSDRMHSQIRSLINEIMRRNETDNISSIALRTVADDRSGTSSLVTPRQEFCYTSSTELA